LVSHACFQSWLETLFKFSRSLSVAIKLTGLAVSVLGAIKNTCLLLSTKKISLFILKPHCCFLSKELQQVF
jgi:hypothetical protein